MNQIAIRLLALIALALGLVGFTGITTAHDATPASSPMSGGMGHGMGGTGAAYMVIDNAGEADTLIGGSTMVAETVEIHEIVDNAGVKEMKPLEHGLELPAGGSVTLKPGGYHVMLFGLTKDLTEGMTFDLTLTFAKAGDVVVQVVVQRTAPEGDAIVSVEAGDLTISGVWSRPAPALHGAAGTPAAATPTT